MFFDALFGGGMFAFRDAAHYYYPLFKFIAEEWAAGRAPLWNPLENLGQPLAADASSSVFYPGKLIFALPISYAWTYRFYVTGHVLLAAFAAYRLARHWGTSTYAAGICAVSYAFCGNVLFQYCNVIYLVGAAWLPFALLAADRMLHRVAAGLARREDCSAAGWAVVLGVVLAMMTLGGDPQMAYNAALLTVLYALLLWISDKQHCKIAISGRGFTWGGSRPALLALAAATGLVLSAVQVLPSLEFAGRSMRNAAPRAEQILGRLQRGTHHDHTYQFSVGPWRLAEYVWPNVSGRQFPINRRWLEVVPAEGRIWTPSLYMGILPLLLAVSVMRLRCRAKERRVDAATKRNPPAVFLSWSVVLAITASFGWYGLGWLLREMHVDAGVGPPLGGLYWLMTLLLPGYARFRYPAKLLVVAALGLSVLSAFGWDRAFSAPADRVRRLLLWLCIVSVAAATAALAIRPFWNSWLLAVEPDVLFGPLDTCGAYCDLLWSFVQTALLCGVFWWLLRERNRTASFARWVPAVALILVAVDLAAANRWMVVCAPAKLWQEQSKLASTIERIEESNTNRISPYRVYRRSIWMRPEWKQINSTTRLADAVRWDRDTLWPKYNLAGRIALAEVYGTMTTADYAEFIRCGRRLRRRLNHQSDRIADRVASHSAEFPDTLLLSKYISAPADYVLPGGKRIEVGVGDVSLWCNPAHRHRAWIAHGNNLWRADSLAGESCRVVHYDPQRVEIEVELIEPATVVLCDQFYPGWRLEVQTSGRPARSAPILHAGGLMRGCRLPAGSHRLIYRYRPTSFFLGAAISTLGWILLAAWCMLAMWKLKWLNM